MQDVSAQTMRNTDLPKFGLMHMKWQTPVYRVSLRGLQPSIVDALNQRVGDAILKHFDALIRANSGQFVRNDWEENGINQVVIFGRFKVDGMEVRGWICGIELAHDDCTRVIIWVLTAPGS